MERLMETIDNLSSANNSPPCEGGQGDVPLDMRYPSGGTSPYPPSQGGLG